MKNIGKSAQEIKDVLQASIVSGQNATLIGPPGTGKTHMCLQAGHAVCNGDGGLIELYLDSSTPPEVVKGAYNPAALLDGRIERVLDGTPYAKGAKIVVCDELYRSPDVVFDSFLHVTESRTIDYRERPVFWATSNFVPTYERVHALVDRFAIWLYVDHEPITFSQMFDAHFSGEFSDADKDWQSTFPTWEEALKIRHTRPIGKQANMLKEYGDALEKEAANNGFVIDNRRRVQWGWLLHCYSVFLAGKEKYSSIPKKAMGILGYAYPSASPEKTKSWRDAVFAFVHKERAALVSMLENLEDNLGSTAVQQFRRDSSFEDFEKVIVSKIERLEPVMAKIGAEGKTAMEEIMAGTREWLLLCALQEDGLPSPTFLSDIKDGLLT